MAKRGARALAGLCVAACCAGVLAGCAAGTSPSEGLVANWTPDPSNYDFHVLLDPAWTRGDSLAKESGAPFAVSNDEAGIMLVGVEDGVARFRANLTCEGGSIWEVILALGDVPDVGFTDAGALFDGATSAEQPAWGQPYFPDSTMTTYRRVTTTWKTASCDSTYWRAFPTTRSMAMWHSGPRRPRGGSSRRRSRWRGRSRAGA